MQRDVLFLELVNKDYEGVKVTLKPYFKKLARVIHSYQEAGYLRLIKEVDKVYIADHEMNILYGTDDINFVTSLVDKIVD